MKFKFERRKEVIASDGERFANEVDAKWHETKRIVRQVMSSTEEEILDAFHGKNEIARFNILALASLLRPPRAKRGSGQSAAGPTLTHTADGGSPQESTAPQTSTTDEPLTAVVSDQPPHEAPEAPDGRRAAAPDEQPEAAGSSPQPAASDPTLAQQLAHVGPHDGDEHYITGHHKRSPRGKASAGTAA